LLFFLALLGALVVPSTGAAAETAETSLLREVNRARAAHGVAPLRLDAALRRAARFHSADMLRRDFFSHGAFAARLQRFGARGRTFSENIAMGPGRSAGARLIVRMWLDSPPHRANLLNPAFRRVGLGAAGGDFGGQAATLVTADFAG
jgi:uncharacterized protein YkwD